MCLRPDRLEQLHALRLLDEPEHHQLARGVDAAAQRALQRPGTRGRRAARAREIGRALCGITHGGVRWSTYSCSTSGAIAGTYWIADAPVPTLATRLPAQVGVVVPAGGVERRRPRSARGPGKSGIFGSTSGPVPDTSTSRAHLALRSSRPASAAPLVPLRRRSPRVFSWMLRAHAEVLGHALEVRADLGLARVGARPVRVGRERERVQVRGHVAGAAGIRVVVPRPADARRRARARRSPRCPARRSRIASPSPENPLPTMAI